MILAFDIGGTRIKAGVHDGQTLTSLGDAPTPGQDLRAFVDTLGRFAAGRSLRGIAISIAGVVDPETGTGRVANIPCIDGLALAPILTQTLGLPALVLNDADCFAMAEARHGAGRCHRNVFGIILGTGVGGGHVIDGRLVQGAGGYAGEWGHGPVIRGDYAYPCGCGQTGCVDTVGGARGLERLCHSLTGQTRDSRAIVTAWRAKEPDATRVIELWADLVSGPLAMVLNVTGAGICPVGGGLSGAPDLIARLDALLRARVLRATDRPLLVPAECTTEPGLIGAAEAGRDAWA